jgi:hypothetical protein
VSYSVCMRESRCVVGSEMPGHERRHEPAQVNFGEMAGITSDISRSGMLVTFPSVAVPGALPNVGEPVRIVIDLPQSVGFSPRCLESMARVVRVGGPGASGPSVAFEIDRIGFRARDEHSLEVRAESEKSTASSYIQ